MTFPAKVNIAFYKHMACNLIPAIYSTSIYVVTSNMRSVLYIYHNGIALTFKATLSHVEPSDKQSMEIYV